MEMVSHPKNRHAGTPVEKVGLAEIGHQHVNF
jgi:hypothetical protein